MLGGGGGLPRAHVADLQRGGLGRVLGCLVDEQRVVDPQTDALGAAAVDEPGEGVGPVKDRR